MKKVRLLTAILAIGAVLVLVLNSCGNTTGTGTTGGTGTTAAGHPLLSNEQLSDIAPGLGAVMVEFSYRNTLIYYAATGGNWDLAAYQMKELGEAQEVGETTRPGRADALKAWEQAYRDPLSRAIQAKDSAAFMDAWNKEVSGCNSCHVSQGFKYIQWTLPKTTPENLTLTAVP